MKKTIFTGAVALALAAVASNDAANDWTRIYLGSNPSVGGDGRQFAFEWNDHLWLAPTEGGYARRLGTGAAYDSWPVMSPDCSKIAFSSDREGGTKVFVFDVARDVVSQITWHSESTWPRAWTPDGKSLLCQSYRDASGPKTCERITIVPAESRGAETFPFDVTATDPAMSPDGSALLFTRRGDELYRKRPHSIGPAAGQIWMFKTATREFVPIVVHTGDCRNPLWMPDGKGFYYLDATGGVRNVWKHDLATGAEKQLTFFTDDHVFQPTLSADGKTLVFRQAFDFWRLDPTKEGSAPERIVLHPEPGYVERGSSRRRYYNVCWNNDADGDVSFCDNGTQIAFTAGGDLYVMDTVIREPTLVQGSTATHERECVFSPDGSVLYYLSDRGDSSTVMKAEPVDPSRPWWENSSFVKTPLVDNIGQRQALSISPDGGRLAWQDPCGVFTFADTNGTILTRGPNATMGGSYAWSPDGKWVAAQLTDENGNAEVWIIPTEKSERPPYNLSRNFKYDGEPAWSPDGQMIAFVSERPEMGEGRFLRYVYLDRAVEEVETYIYEFDKSRRTIRENATDPKRYEAIDLPGERFTASEGTLIEWTDLADRVRSLNVRAGRPFFRWDSRTIAYSASERRTDTVKIPERLAPSKLFDCAGSPRDWVKKDDRVLWVVNRLPAINDVKYGFTVYQNTDYADYQELAFRTAWGRIRDMYYDPKTHGVDWVAVGARYLEPARNASSYSVFIRVMNMVLGELDSSHLGFYADDNSRQEWVRRTPSAGWNEVTAHLGLRFEREGDADGWTVKDVIPGGPADRHGIGIQPGDVVIAIDGESVGGGIDPAKVLNGPANRKVRVTYRRAGGSAETVVITSCDYTKARSLITAEELRAKRKAVHEKSGGRLGYLNIDAMNWESFWSFQHDVFSEGYGRDGLIIDVRWNYGGFTADQMLQILLGGDHSRAVTRTCGAGYLFGYWGRPVWSKPIVVLCNEYTGSNGEIFSHAIKTLKRGKLVGRETGGGVIGTFDNPLLDMGSFRDARYGWFVLDGTDMEHNGAKPDFEVDDLPGDLDAGIDRQLDKAIEVLDGEVEAWKKANPPVDFRYAN